MIVECPEPVSKIPKFEKGHKIAVSVFEIQKPESRSGLLLDGELSKTSVIINTPESR